MGELTVKNRVKELWLKKQGDEGREIQRDEICQAIGVSRQTLYTWFENRITSFDAHKVAAFCKYFNVGIAELLVLESDEPQHA